MNIQPYDIIAIGTKMVKGQLTLPATIEVEPEKE